MEKGWKKRKLKVEKEYAESRNPHRDGEGLEGHAFLHRKMLIDVAIRIVMEKGWKTQKNNMATKPTYVAIRIVMEKGWKGFMRRIIKWMYFKSQSAS